MPLTVWLLCVQVSAGVGALPLDLRDFIASKPKLGDTLKPMPNERALLSFLVTRIANLDPDVIVGHNICGFDMDVLLHRIAHNNVQNWVRGLCACTNGGDGIRSFVFLGHSTCWRR